MNSPHTALLVSVYIQKWNPSVIIYESLWLPFNLLNNVFISVGQMAYFQRRTRAMFLWCKIKLLQELLAVFPF